MRIYVAGPMRGVPNFNYPRFNAVAQILRDQGHEVVNPVDIGLAFGKPEQINADEGLLRDVVKEEAALVPTCDAIFLLKGWQRSVGAKRELQVALAMGIEVMVEELTTRAVSGGTTQEDVPRLDFARRTERTVRTGPKCAETKGRTKR